MDEGTFSRSIAAGGSHSEAVAQAEVGSEAIAVGSRVVAKVVNVPCTTYISIHRVARCELVRGVEIRAGESDVHIAAEVGVYFADEVVSRAGFIGAMVRSHYSAVGHGFGGWKWRGSDEANRVGFEVSQRLVRGMIDGRCRRVVFPVLLKLPGDAIAQDGFAGFFPQRPAEVERT